MIEARSTSVPPREQAMGEGKGETAEGSPMLPGRAMPGLPEKIRQTVVQWTERCHSRMEAVL
jgi:hypothetical protein